MHRSKREGAYSYLECWADLTELSEMRKVYSRSVGVRVTTNDFFLPGNGAGDDGVSPDGGRVIDGDPGHIQISPGIGVGFAVAAPQGLVVPVIHDIQGKSLPQIAIESDTLLHKARANKLVLEDFYGANVVLSGLGCTAFIPSTPSRSRERRGFYPSETSPTRSCRTATALSFVNRCR